MSNIFSTIKVHYKDGNNELATLVLSSIQFDINQTTIGYAMPFTTELSFEVRVESVESESAIIDGKSNLKEEIFKDFAIEYYKVGGDANTPGIVAGLFLTHIVRQTPEERPWRESVWKVWLRFYGKTPDNNHENELYYPKIKAPSLDFSLTDFNHVLKTHYELLVLHDSSSASIVGRVADEIADSVVKLTEKVGENLGGTISTRLQPAGSTATNDIALWVVILKSMEDLSFKNYFDFMEQVFCGTSSWDGHVEKAKETVRELRSRRASPFIGVDAYQSVKIATEAFMMVNCMCHGLYDEQMLEKIKANLSLTNGDINQQKVSEWWSKYKEMVNGSASTIPYLAVIRRKLKDADLKTTSFERALAIYGGAGAKPGEEAGCYGIIQEKLTHPCFLELIWSYWHEESMLVQGINAIGRRFQNIKAPGDRDPLAGLSVDPLRPLSNLLWGYIQDEQHRLTVRRRAYEYDHHYGITLQGGAVRNLRPADSRSKFLEAFHILLHLTSKFYRQADDMTVQPDAFPILNALREVHLVLSEGAHNQYGDLPWTARAEMLIQQWLLARPEMREFLPSRIMVAYPEPWMDRVSSLNALMGWTKTSVIHFRDLGVFGEQLLLSIRFGDWANVNDRHAAANWARFWRPQVQAYTHAYRAVTGVDLTAELAVGGRVDATQPSIHLMRRLREQR